MCILFASEVVKPDFEFASRFLARQRDTFLRALENALEKVPPDEDTRLVPFEARIDSVPGFVGESIQEGKNLNVSRLSNPLAYKISFNRTA